MIASLTLAWGATDAAAPARSHPEFRRTAEAAYRSKNYPAAREAWAAALALRPDSPRYLHNLAATQALTGEAETAVATLQRLAALGIATRVEGDEDFASLRDRADFREVCASLARNRQPQGAATLAFELPGEGRLIEGIAYREATGEFFFGDVHHRAIWRRSRDGRVTRFDSPESGGFGRFGLALDEKRQALWAAWTAVPASQGFTSAKKGTAGLSKFDLATGQMLTLGVLPPNGLDHVVGDLLVTPDGSAVFVTDSAAPIIWRYDTGSGVFKNWLEYPGFGSLQGLALVGDSLVVSDYANGLFVISLTPPSPTVRPLAPPAGATLLGIDGLVAVPGGLVGVQNGVTPSRLIHIVLAPDLTAIKAVTVLAAALPQMTDLSLVTLVNGRPTFIANAGWDSFDPATMAHPPARPVYIFQTAAP